MGGHDTADIGWEIMILRSKDSIIRFLKSDLVGGVIIA